MLILQRFFFSLTQKKSLPGLHVQIEPYIKTDIHKKSGLLFFEITSIRIFFLPPPLLLLLRSFSFSPVKVLHLTWSQQHQHCRKLYTTCYNQKNIFLQIFNFQHQLLVFYFLYYFLLHQYICLMDNELSSMLKYFVVQ